MWYFRCRYHFGDELERRRTRTGSCRIHMQTGSAVDALSLDLHEVEHDPRLLQSGIEDFAVVTTLAGPDLSASEVEVVP